MKAIITSLMAFVFAMVCMAAVAADDQKLTPREMTYKADVNCFTPRFPTISYQDLRQVLKKYDSDEAERDRKYTTDLQAAADAAKPKGTSAPPASSSVPATVAAPAATEVAGADLKDPAFQARLAARDPATVAIFMAKFKQVLETRYPASGPMRAPPAVDASPAEAMNSALGRGSPLQSDVANAMTLPMNAQANAAVGAVERQKSPALPLDYNEAWKVVKLFQDRNQKKLVDSVCIEAPFDRGYNVVDADNPKYRGKIASFETAVERNSQRNDPARVAQLPEPPRAAGSSNFPLGTADLRTTKYVLRDVDRSKGANRRAIEFDLLRPMFQNDAARSVFETAIGKPTDPAYYATHDFVFAIATPIAAKAAIEALPPSDQAAVLANVLLYVRSRGDDVGGVGSLIKAFPQLNGIEYVWLSANNGEPVVSRGSLADFLGSFVRLPGTNILEPNGDRVANLALQKVSPESMAAIARVAPLSAH